MTTKGMIVFGLTIMLLTCGLSGRVANANEISYGAIGADINNECSKEHPELCAHQQSNEYERGCSPEVQCRSRKMK